MAIAHLLGVDLYVGKEPVGTMFRYIRDFLACRNGIADFTPNGPNPGPGYEIVDEQYGTGEDTPGRGDTVTLKSNGESNTYHHHLTMRIINRTDYGTDNQIAITVSLPDYMALAYTEYSEHIFPTLGKLSIHADLDECHIVFQTGGNLGEEYKNTTNHWRAFGRFKPDHLLYDGTATKIESPVEGTTNKIIQLPIWPGWAKKGRKLYSWDTKSIHVLTITDVNEASQTITVDTSYQKDAGSWMAEDLCIFSDDGYNEYPLPIFSRKGDPKNIVVSPIRNCHGAPGKMYVGRFGSYIGDYIDSLYNTPICSDIWLGGRGKFALAKQTNPTHLNGYSLSDVDGYHGVAIRDMESGQAWRCYYCAGSAWIALKEGI